MINFKFVKGQFKNIRIPLLIFFIILIIIMIPALIQNYLAPTSTTTREEAGSSATEGIGAMPYLNVSYFGIPGLILICAFSLILNYILVSKEVDKGYLASWLTLPVSRKKILNSKLFVLLSAILILYFSVFIVQLIIFPIKFKDFKLQQFEYLVLFNFGLILLAIMWAAINWFFICSLNKTVVALSLTAGIAVIFILCQSMTLFSSIPSMAYFKYFRYFTIASLLNSPFQYGEPPNLNPPVGTTVVSVAPLFSIKASNFIWQYILMFFVPFDLFYSGNYYFVKKDLHL